MLAMGIPVVANSGVGDVEEVIAGLAAGAIIHSFDEDAYAAAIEQIGSLPSSPTEISVAAQAIFDLERGISSYDSIYREIALPNPARLDCP